MYRKIFLTIINNVHVISIEQFHYKANNNKDQECLFAPKLVFRCTPMCPIFFRYCRLSSACPLCAGRCRL